MTNETENVAVHAASSGIQPPSAGAPSLPGIVDLAYCDADTALEALGTTRSGLAEEEVEARRERFGRNEVAHERPPTWYAELGRAFANPFNFLLTTLAGVSGATGDREADDRDRPHGGVQYRAAVRPGISLEPVSAGSARPRAHERGGGAADGRRTRGKRTPPCAAGRSPWTSWCPGTSCICRRATWCPADVRLLDGQGLVRRPGRAHRRGPSGRESGSGVAASRRPPRRLPNRRPSASWAPTSSAARRPRWWSHGDAHDLRPHGPRARRASARTTASTSACSKVSWLLIRFMVVMVPIVFLINGVQGRLARGVSVRARRRRRPHARDAADDRHRQPGQGRGDDGAARR